MGQVIGQLPCGEVQPCLVTGRETRGLEERLRAAQSVGEAPRRDPEVGDRRRQLDGEVGAARGRRPVEHGVQISGRVVVPPDHGGALRPVELTRPGARSRNMMVGERDLALLEVFLVLEAGPCIRPDGAEHDEPHLDA